MATENKNPLWKPPKEVRRSINRGERKIKAANQRILEENLKARDAHLPRQS